MYPETRGRAICVGRVGPNSLQIIIFISPLTSSIRVVILQGYCTCQISNCFSKENVALANAHAYCWSHLVQLVYLWVADVRAFATANHKYTRTECLMMN